MEQLEEEIVHAELHERRNRGMAKIAIRFPCHSRELMGGNCVTHERPDHIGGHFGVWFTGEACDLVRLEPRPARRHIKAAVACQSRKRRLDKTDLRSFPPGGDVLHEDEGSPLGLEPAAGRTMGPTSSRCNLLKSLIFLTRGGESSRLNIVRRPAFHKQAAAN